MWSTLLKKVAAPLVIAIRGAASAGSALFGVLKIFKYLEKENDPSALPLAGAAIAVNAITYSGTGAPAIYRKFRDWTDQIEAKKTADIESGIKSDNKDKEKNAISEPEIKLSTKAKILYYHNIIFGGILPGFYTSMAAYLSLITLAEFMAELGNTDLHDTTEGEFVAQLLGISGIAANVIYFSSFRYKKSDENAKKAAYTLIDSKDSLWDKHAYKTLAASIFGMISTPFMAYFSTSNSFYKLPFLLPSYMIAALSGLSMYTSTLSALISDIPATHAFFSRKNKDYFYKPAKCESCTKTAIYSAGAVDAFGSNGVSTFISMATTLGDFTGQDSHSSGMIYPSILCALSKMLMGFLFGVKEATIDTIEDYHKSSGDPRIPYDLSSTTEETQPLNKDNNATPPAFYGSVASSSSPLLFNSNADTDQTIVSNLKPDSDDQYHYDERVLLAASK